MSITQMDDFTWKFSSQPDEITGDPTGLKTNMDSRGVALRSYINETLIPALEATADNTSGADQIGMTAITETGAAATVQAVIEALITRLKAVEDTVSGADLIGMTAITETGAAATVQAVIEALITKIKAVADGASGADLTGMTPITETGANATVQSIIEALLTRLKAVTDNVSGADLIGMTTITETGVAATVQAVIEALITRLKAVTDSASGADLVGATPITSLGAAATVQAILEALAVMTTQGDIMYQGASAPARLAKGTASQVLQMNSGATAPEWTSSPALAGLAVDTDTVKVDSTNHRVGFGVTAPSHKVDVNGDFRIQGEQLLRFGGTGASDTKFTMGYNTTNNSIRISYVGA